MSKKSKAIKNHYKGKGFKVNKTALRTAQIVGTALVVAIFSIIIYFIATEGWHAVIEWLTSKWACMFAIIIIVAITIALWLVSVYMQFKKLKEGDE